MRPYYTEPQLAEMRMCIEKMRFEMKYIEEQCLKPLEDELAGNRFPYYLDEKVGKAEASVGLMGRRTSQMLGVIATEMP